MYTGIANVMISDAAERSRALGEFLRAQRERIAVALETGQHQRRRRTSGLRREEVAASAGISPIWCMRIEQGRAASVSSHALARIAEALHLAPAERAHMFALAGRQDPAFESGSASLIPASLRQCVDQFAGPAYLMDGHWDVIAANAVAVSLFGNWMAEAGNMLRFVFLDEAAKRLIDNWPDRAKRLLAEFRLDYGRRFQDSTMTALVRELQGRSEERRVGKESVSKCRSRGST